jgi:hypothetical protein
LADPIKADDSREGEDPLHGHIGDIENAERDKDAKSEDAPNHAEEQGLGEEGLQL